MPMASDANSETLMLIDEEMVHESTFKDHKVVIEEG
jgi:hypothetical protein